MAGTGVGINLDQIGDRSHLKFKRDIIINPRAANDAIVVASVDPTGVALGATFTLLSTASFAWARRVNMTITDAVFASALTITVRVTGIRFGRVQSEVLTATSTSTTPVVVSSALVYDQVTSIVLTDKTNAAAGDAVKFGIDGAVLGLTKPIAKVSDVKLLVKIAAGTEGAPTAVSSSTVDAAWSAIKGLTIAATDVYIVEYALHGEDGMLDGGRNAD